MIEVLATQYPDTYLHPSPEKSCYRKVGLAKSRSRGYARKVEPAQPSIP